MTDAKEGPKWRHIESAPKDGEGIDLWVVTRTIEPDGQVKDYSPRRICNAFWVDKHTRRRVGGWCVIDAPFARAWGDELFLWSRDDLERFRRDGMPTSNPRYGDNTPIYCVIEPGKDHEDRSDDYLFTVGDFRALARAAGGDNG